MGDVISIGDEVRFPDGRIGRITWKGDFADVYRIEVGDKIIAAMRFEFQPVKWEGDVIGNTGIGVCAQNGSEAAL